MNILENIKAILGERSLRKDMARRRKRTVKYVDMHSALKIGFITNLDDEKSFFNVTRLAKKYAAEGKDVSVLYCSTKKEVPGFYTLEPTLLSRDELNFYGKPDPEKTKWFLNAGFDFLFDFSDESSFTVKYLFVLSNAHIKVSKTSLDTHIYADIVLSLDEKNEFQDYSKAIETYLNIAPN
ncbi:MAG: hypothetical protein PHR20_04435 [Bacteroidales bacterium]|nr:hypothetical protein [Bacteroidales bacterium]